MKVPTYFMNFETRTKEYLELGFRAEVLYKLKAYLELLWSTNEELNLISRQMTFAELIDNHIIDCLLPLKHFPTGCSRVADFGSGGGLPAVIYGLQFPETKFLLFEKSPKKQDFLRRCQELVPNIEVFGEIPSKLSGVDLVTARGFKPIDVILELSRSYYKAGGKYFLLKARAEKIAEEAALAKQKFKDLKLAVVPLESPVLAVERHLVLI